MGHDQQCDRVYSRKILIQDTVDEVNSHSLSGKYKFFSSKTSHNIIKVGIGQSCDITDCFLLKLSGLIMESRVDAAGDNQNAHVIISNYNIKG